MSGKIVVITGASSGIGFETTRQLAALGATTVMVCRNEERGRNAAIRIGRSAVAEPPAVFVADLASQDQVRALAADLRRSYTRIDVLINNAGAIFAGLPALFPRIVKSIPFLLADAAAGARTPVYVASSPDLDSVSGRFFLKCRPRGSRSITYDRHIAARLWKVSEQQCGLAAVTSVRV